jgi:hypothetical protein
MMNATMPRYVIKVAARMLAGFKSVAPMLSATLATIWQGVNACPTLLGILPLHVSTVSEWVFNHYFYQNMHVFSFIAAPIVEPSLSAGCSNNDDCPEYTACENLQCINPCAKNDPCAALATCKVISHKVVCTCPNGYIGSPQTSCHPREYTLGAKKQEALLLVVHDCKITGISTLPK